MSLHGLLLVIAFVLFVCAALGAGGRVNLTAAGLAAWVLTELLPHVR